MSNYDNSDRLDSFDGHDEQKAMPDAARAQIDAARAGIDALDEQILALLNERMTLCLAIGRAKAALCANMPDHVSSNTSANTCAGRAEFLPELPLKTMPKIVPELVRDAVRETAVIDRLASEHGGVLQKKQIADIWTVIMATSRALQEEFIMANMREAAEEGEKQCAASAADFDSSASFLSCTYSSKGRHD